MRQEEARARRAAEVGVGVGMGVCDWVVWGLLQFNAVR